MADMGLGASDGIAFLVSATMVADIIAKACSSPQTAEINADKRSATLMKWVKVGTVEAILLLVVAAYIDPKHRAAIIAGATTELVITYGEYVHANQSGLAAGMQGTESLRER